MLMSQRHRTQCRQVTGPTPHAVAVRARDPSSRPPDYLILERRKQEASRNKVIEFSKDQSTCDLRMNWERNTEQRMVSATIERRVHEAMEKYQMDIDERRERLRNMLESEERDFLRMMEEQGETVLERQTKMRARAKYLQEKRESERQKVAAEKLDQLFREQCEELRAAETRRRQQEVCRDRAAQIQTQGEARRLNRDEELIFAQLWESDRLAKEERENQQAQRKRESNFQTLAFLRDQMEAADQQRQQAKQLKEEEAKLLHEQREMLRLEEQRELRQKLHAQESRRRQLDRSLRLKMKRLAREQQDELALDMSILEQLLTHAKDEKKEEALKKLELREERQRYRQYLAEQLEEQRRHEAETEQLIEAELQQTWNRRAAQWRLEKEARDRLMRDVLDTRRLQIQEKLECNALKQVELAKERDDLNRIIQENKLLDEQEKTCLRESCQEYQADLLAQMLHQQQLREAEQAEKEKEIQRGLIYQEKYNQKIQDILSRPVSSTTAVHPFRRRDRPTSS